jgi:zinc-ribbon domain
MTASEATTGLECKRGENVGKFCTRCGLPLAENNKFCNACGAATFSSSADATGAVPTPSRRVMAKATRATKSGSVLRKTVLLLLIAVLVCDGVWLLIGYSARRKTLANLWRNPCTFVSKQEIEEVMGSSFERMEANPPACDYFTSGTPSWVRTEFHWGEGVAYMGVFRRTGKMFNMSIKPVPGVGEEAYFDAAENTFSVRKKDNALTIDLRFYPNALEKGKALAGKALQHM